jgi:hypothetical protein
LSAQIQEIVDVEDLMVSKWQPLEGFMLLGYRDNVSSGVASVFPVKLLSQPLDLSTIDKRILTYRAMNEFTECGQILWLNVYASGSKRH